MRRIAVASADDFQWASSLLGNAWPNDTKGIVVANGERRRALIGYNAFYDDGCTAHIVSDGSRSWVGRGVLYAMFAYPFLQCGLGRVTLTIPVANIDAQVFALRVGFSVEGRVRAARGADHALYGMLKNECMWIKEIKHG